MIHESEPTVTLPGSLYSTCSIDTQGARIWKCAFLHPVELSGAFRLPGCTNPRWACRGDKATCPCPPKISMCNPTPSLKNPQSFSSTGCKNALSYAPCLRLFSCAVCARRVCALQPPRPSARSCGTAATIPPPGAATWCGIPTLGGQGLGDRGTEPPRPSARVRSGPLDICG